MGGSGTTKSRGPNRTRGDTVMTTVGRAVLIAWLLFTLASPSGLAQTSLGDWQNAQNLPADSSISVKTRARDRFRGSLVEVSSNGLALDSDERGFPGRVTRRRNLRREDIQEIRLQARAASLLAGAAIGAGVGAGIGAGVESQAKSNEDQGVLTATFAVLGGVLGLLIARHYPVIKGTKIYVRP